MQYDCIEHSPTFTAQQTAESSHISAKELAKTIVLKWNSQYVLAVLPSHRLVNLSQIRKELGSDDIEIASEFEFAELFPDCELGAMPPFGELFGVPVYIDEELSKAEFIAFNAGSHTELIRLTGEDFLRLLHAEKICRLH